MPREGGGGDVDFFLTLEEYIESFPNLNFHSFPYNQI